MFERYTEKARRVIFFARYEASQYGSQEIDSEHLLLGLLREAKSVHKWIPNATGNTIREWVEGKVLRKPPIPTSVDLPLSEASKKILKAASEAADNLTHRHIGTEHLFLGMLAVSGCVAAELLAKGGANAALIRAELAKQPSQDGILLLQHSNPTLPRRPISFNTVEIHGTKRNTDYVREVVSMIRRYNWHWHKMVWKPRDIVISRQDNKFSFEMSLSADLVNFMVVKQGWKRDRCFICEWELFESEDEHGIGYTNGRNWLCVECCERFIQKDFFSSSYSDFT